MKKSILILMAVFLLCISNICFADKSVTFSWDANTEPDLSFYSLYESDSSGDYTFGPGHEVLKINAGAETGSYIVTLPAGTPSVTKYWVLTATDTSNNESAKSNEVSKLLDSISPSNPTGLYVTVIVTIIRSGRTAQ